MNQGDSTKRRFNGYVATVLAYDNLHQVVSLSVSREVMVVRIQKHPNITPFYGWARWIWRWQMGYRIRTFYHNTARIGIHYCIQKIHPDADRVLLVGKFQSVFWNGGLT